MTRVAWNLAGLHISRSVIQFHELDHEEIIDIPCCSKIPPHTPFIRWICEFGFPLWLDRLRLGILRQLFGIDESEGVKGIWIGI